MHKHAVIMNYIISITLLSFFGFNSIIYLLVGRKLRKAAVTLNDIAVNAQIQIEKYNRSAKVMLLFVLAFLAQWVCVMAFYIWALLAMPPLAMVVLVVIFANLGGVFNFIAYTWLKRKFVNVVGTAS